MSADGEPVRSVALRTPAKVNLGLRLVGRRADGYHLLESVFAPIDLFDDLEIRWAEAGEDVTRLALDVPASAGLPPALAEVTGGPDNLVVRAAEAFRGASGLRGTIELRLTKRIPAGAGLGGGSSDAGAVLAGLALLAGPGAPPLAALAELALGLGADVPYFLAPRPARVSGIGERIEPEDGLPALDLVLVNPGVSVATAAVYRAADALSDSLTGPGAGPTMPPISRLRDERVGWAAALGELLVNDLEPAAIRLCPPIGRWMTRLRSAGALGVGLSGSGGTVFGVFPDASAAEAAAGRLERIRLEGERPVGEGAWLRVTRVLPDPIIHARGSDA